MPKIMRHYFVTRGETIAQFEGIGPFWKSERLFGAGLGVEVSLR